MGTGAFPTETVDHINGIKSDNRISNLKPASHYQNSQNSKISTRSTTGVKGVHWSSKRNAFIARLRVNGKKLQIGEYACVLDAAKALELAREKAHGEFANHGVNRFLQEDIDSN